MGSRSTQLLAGFFDRLLDVTCWVSGVIYLFMMLSVVYEVLSRRLFGSPTTWVVDISTLGLLVAALVPSAWVLKHHGHVNIELVSGRLSVKNRSLLNLVTYSLALLGCLVFVWQGIEFTVGAYRDNETLFRSLVIPKAWYIWIFAASFTLLIVQLLREMARFYRELRGGGNDN